MSHTSNHLDTVNLSGAKALLIEQSHYSLEVLSQIFMGLGLRKLQRATSVEKARQMLERQSIDLLVLDTHLADGDGHDLIRWMRRSAAEANRTIPVIVVSANSATSAVERARDAGASFFVLKPLTPAKLLDRILWVTRDSRPFFIGADFVGPDRRFRIDGPPPEEGGRRADDSGANHEHESQPAGAAR